MNVFGKVLGHLIAKSFGLQTWQVTMCRGRLVRGNFQYYLNNLGVYLGYRERGGNDCDFDKMLLRHRGHNLKCKPPAQCLPLLFSQYLQVHSVQHKAYSVSPKLTNGF